VVRPEGNPEAAQTFEAALARATVTAEINAAVRAVQAAVSDAIANVTGALSAGDRQRTLGRLGAPSVVEDIGPIGAVLAVGEALDKLSNKLTGHIRTFAESHVASAMAALNQPALQTPQVLPFAIAMVMQRLAAPWQIVRLGIAVAASDDEIRVAGTPFGVTVTMAIHDLSRVASELRNDIKRGHFQDTSSHLKTLHDGVRGLRTELDIRTDRPGANSSPRSVRRYRIRCSLKSMACRAGAPLLRQGPDKDVTSANRIDPDEVEETAALIDFVAVCRNYASELAINEVSLRAQTELQHYVEKATETLVESLRTPIRRSVLSARCKWKPRSGSVR
jgi:hypothetical protein